ncbi:helix-hairpin-helix domain-containing protein [Chitinophaga agrisoli]|uniref:Helix-hairpin-helix domain-containing protein n=1 Tax=Chitinophaga agrisoli TaxID=2607653 RepID=A0A5B2W5L4_9BACT|nr:helix-hairpin-helix domain-containing protein [Chitinophaga agrisoli]KAA2245667.1 helix-hairpin-helix domain-containing protein [Chitinophaga agrisoli]
MDKRPLREYFGFSKRERVGILTLLAVIAVSLCIPRIWEIYLPPVIPTDSSFLAEVTAFEQQLAAADTTPRKSAYGRKHYRQEQGDQPYRYGNQYSSPRQNHRYSNYTQENHNYPRQQAYPHPDSPAPRKTYPPRPARKLPILNINTSDSLDLEILPGIGPALAGRIIRFRERLGGFHSPAQVAETYGLPDSTFKKIQPYLRVDNVSLKKLDINHTDEQSLAQHPYIRYKLAKLIVRYRTVHGPFSDIKGIKNIPLVDDSIYRKIEPYISSN